jgi:lipopolysaccharide transport system ATP-binding protein
MQPIIRVCGLGKRYRIGARRLEPVHGMARLGRLALAPFDYIRMRLRPPAESEILWALRNVGFEVNAGEVLGIIGRNGSGKSTLLKILSRITDPSEGYAEVRGRVNSLLEVGTGFHPELTGRENIYLNAAIHGVSKRDIDSRFDEIVAFSEVDRFIDTPVKRYSSGMYTRLAFGVAAHLDPDILLVDEVLAVGDIGFQKKCLGQMSKVAREGRTVLFVSHNMAAIGGLCNRLLMLDGGLLVASGPTPEILPLYIAAARSTSGQISWNDPAAAPGNSVVRLLGVRVVCEDTATADVPIDKPVTIELDYLNLVGGSRVMTAVHITDSVGTSVLSTMNAPSACVETDPWFDKPRPVGRYRSRCTLPANFLNDGLYRVSPIFLTGGAETAVHEREIVSFMVHETGAMRKEYQGAWLGVVRPRLAWATMRDGGQG